MLRHHLPLADEIVVNEGYSRDGTYERIRGIDPKIRIFRSHWETPKNLQWCVGFKEAARKACTGDWCIHLDSDEFIPEWEFESIRRHLESTTELMVAVRFLNFYGNYRVLHANPQKVHWPDRKMIIHRNLSGIEIWGDGSNVRIRGQDFTWGTTPMMFTVHHFGMVRDPAILRQKWWVQGRAVTGRSLGIRPPGVLFRLFPHDWRDPQFFGDLTTYDGPFIQAVRNDPAEFTRDNMGLFRAVAGERQRTHPAETL
jgi:glycosyltransferase involved in cell wall biosynthesis